MPTAQEKVQVNVLLPEKLNAQIRVVADVDDDRISAAIEKAVKAYIESRKADPDWQEKHDAWAKKQRALLRAL